MPNKTFTIVTKGEIKALLEKALVAAAADEAKHLRETFARQRETAKRKFQNQGWWRSLLGMRHDLAWWTKREKEKANPFSDPVAIRNFWQVKEFRKLLESLPEDEREIHITLETYLNIREWAAKCLNYSGTESSAK